MLRNVFLISLISPLLSGCGALFYIALLIRGSGPHVARIDISMSHSEVCAKAITEVEDGYEAFQGVTASYGSLSSAGTMSDRAKLLRLSAARSSLIWLPARISDHGNTFQVAQGRLDVSDQPHPITLLLGKSNTSFEQIGYVGFPEGSSFEFAVLISDPLPAAFSLKRLFQTPDETLPLPSHSDSSIRIIRLKDLDSQFLHAKTMQLLSIDDETYLLATGETTNADDPQLKLKLPTGFPLNWPATLTELKFDGALNPICSYVVHTRSIFYGMP